ncbi:unnamed protein product [Somion occarium]|uniref:Zn(2)-C6 fungal-type domain-containing protein n=1 Tax=Somion occarium TaxID=3059160 RepID=A0ABP1DWF3_9APHY
MSSSRSTDLPPAPGPSTFSRAPKGKACLNCRRRKMKCDCVRPVCGQCVRFNRERDCEYTDGDQRSRTEILEEQIATLQARIGTLENPVDPVATIQVSQFRNGSRRSPFEDPAEFGIDHMRSNSQVPYYPDVTQGASDVLVQAFLTYAEDLGCFLNVPRLLAHTEFMLSNVVNGSQDPLLNTIYLWGSILRGDHNESHFLERALHNLPKAYACNHPNILQIIQTEVLLANYFFYGNRFVEARAHLSAAVSTTLTHRFHKIRSANEVISRTLDLTDIDTQLLPALDSVEEGERIHAFWIETPWPLTAQVFQAGHVGDEYRGNRTIQRFLNEPIVNNTPSVLSTLALRAQATALLDRAKWLSSTCSADLALLNIHQNAFNMLDAQIEDFILSLPPLDVLRIHPPAQTRSLVTTHMVARMAIMQLHIAFADTDVTASIKALSASKAIIAAFKVLYPERPEFAEELYLHAEPFLLILLTSSARVMIIEQNKYNTNQALWQTMATCKSISYMRAVLGELIEQMGKVNPKSRLTALQVQKVDNSRVDPLQSLPPMIVPSH